MSDEKLEQEMAALVTGREKAQEARALLLAKDKLNLADREIEDLEARIRAKATEIQEAEKADWRAKLLRASEEVALLFAEKNGHLKQAEEKDLKIIEARKIVSQVPTKRVQISSKFFVTLEKEIEIPDEITPLFETNWLTGSQTATFEVKKKKIVQQITIDATPSRVDRCRAAGWRLRPGERMPEEELDGNNSIEQPICEIPENLRGY